MLEAKFRGDDSVTLVIARQARGAYLESVIAALLRLLSIAAMILMPIGMGMAPAAAATPASHKTMESSGDGHCGQKPDSDNGKAMAMQCAGSCSALPSEPAATSDHELARMACHTAGRVKVLHGVLLALSTPPPRIA
jgi:hypothetical protein